MRPALLLPAALLLLGPAACATTTPRACAAARQAPEAPEFVTADEAAASLLDRMHMGEILTQTMDQALDLQIEQNPQLAPLKPTMQRFFRKYMSWESLRPEMLKIYANAFTKSELEAMIAFYETDVGRKSIELMPELMKQGGEMGARQVQEHIGELEQMIVEEMQRQNQP